MTKSTKKFDEIECPKCGHSIPVSEALHHQLTEELKEQIDQKEKDFSIREKEIKDKEAQINAQVQFIYNEEKYRLKFLPDKWNYPLTVLQVFVILGIVFSGFYAIKQFIKGSDA